MMKHVNLDFGKNSLLSNIDFNINILFIFVQVRKINKVFISFALWDEKHERAKSFKIDKRYTPLLQAICSCLAGVYNEYLLKSQGANINIFLQNVFMYIDSIVCNLLVLTIQGNPIRAFDNVGSSIIFQPKVVAIMINNAAIGIITSFFLKNLNSILKTFASALELMFTAILCWIIFDIPIHMNTVLAIAMVSYAVILYSQNPVNNVKPKPHEFGEEESETLYPAKRQIERV